MLFSSIVRLFEQGNVCVCGLRGCGKDMLFANVIMRRKKPYVSNTDYGGVHYPFNPADFDCGKNTYKNFLSGTINSYVFPYPDGTDLYISDAGVYFPAQYCNELNRDYGYFATYAALSRHTSAANVHTNTQAFQRCWDKLREQSDITIRCIWCNVFAGFVIQKVMIYEKQQSAIDRVPLFPVPRPWFSLDRIQRWELAKAQYTISYGKIRSGILFYRNRSNYNTRVFRDILGGAQHAV